MPSVSLTELQQQIAARERELQTLRQELESRQGHLTELNRRKADLQKQLKQVEKEIAALTPAAPAQTEQPRAAEAPSPAKAESETTVNGQPRLGELILTMLRESKEPMTARQLSEEARRRGFQSVGRDPVKSVEARLQELKKRGVVRRASGLPGYILSSAAHTTNKPSNKAKAPSRPEDDAKKQSVKQTTSPGAAKTAKTGRRAGQPTLREVLTGILKSSRKMLTGNELAQRVRAAGYQSDREDFVESVWSMLGKMDNVEHVRGQGYRLKRS